MSERCYSSSVEFQKRLTCHLCVVVFEISPDAEAKKKECHYCQPELKSKSRSGSRTNDLFVLSGSLPMHPKNIDTDAKCAFGIGKLNAIPATNKAVIGQSNFYALSKV